MIGQIESLLERGIEAARAKDKKRARDLLLSVIELDQRNEKAWLWLSSVVETPADREVCLENVLIINPDNTYAAMGLKHLRQQPRGESAPSSVLPRLASPRPSAEQEWGKPAAEAAPPPAVRVCAKCGFRNPGWAYLCDNCGANLRQVNLREALREASKRGSSFITLLEAWGGALVFNRSWAFQPETELVSWGRTLAALGLAALLASIWRALMSLVLQLLASRGEWDARIAISAFGSALQTLPATLLLTLASVPIALLTWAAARLMGGQKGFRTHLHLIAVAVSAWVALTALLIPFTVVVPYILSGDTRMLPSDALIGLVTFAAGVAGLIWLIQAIRTAHDIPLTRTILATTLAAALSVALFLVLQLLIGEGFTSFLSSLMVAPFLPLPGAGA